MVVMGKRVFSMQSRRNCWMDALLNSYFKVTAVGGMPVSVLSASVILFSTLVKVVIRRSFELKLIL